MTAYAIQHRGRRRRARHEFLMMHGRRRRGGRHGFGPPGFDRMFFGPGRKAGRGDIRATILALLAEEPMHGYQIIQEVTDRTGGAWRPSPGSVYPTLQQLEDEELVRTVHTDGRRVFELTDAGREQAAALPSQTPGSPRATATTTSRRSATWPSSCSAQRVRWRWPDRRSRSSPPRPSCGRPGAGSISCSPRTARATPRATARAEAAAGPRPPRPRRR